MVIKDRVYGEFDITSEVIIDLVNSAPVQRLKAISQGGIPDVYFFHDSFSRYEHSVGVMLLLKMLGASEEEQIAGLLHDVSHTAFSHVIDYVVGDGGNEEYQDSQHEWYVLSSEIPSILEKHNYSAERIVDYYHFGLLERDIPDLCADRIDYSFREFPLDVAKECVSGLTVAEGRIAFKNQQIAHWFAVHFLKVQEDLWGSFESVARYQIFARILRRALENGIVTMADFWQYDDFVMNKILAANDEVINQTLSTLKIKSLADVSKSGQAVLQKFRFVDPHFIEQGRLVRLKDVNEDFALELERARMTNERGHIMPDVPILNDAA